MPNLKEVRIRIESVRSTQQITSAMKLVSASKLRRAQDAILRMRPYAKKLNEILQNLSSSLEDMEIGSFTQQRKPEKVLIIVISANRGLCGAFNSNIIKLTNKVIREQYQEQYQAGNLHLLFLGKKAGEYFKRRNFQVVDINTEIFDQLSFEKAVPVAEQLMQEFLSRNYDRIDLVYNQFKNAAVQSITHEQYLPIKPAENKDDGKFSHDYLFEPDKVQIVNEMIPKSLKIQLYKALLDSQAAEYGARMTAMHIATDNAQELLKDLRLSYNKARQAAITNEIIEIVSGANALK
ncbi:MAG: ATP synthase F1 subunit gamma [Bacteroidetes bacterium]|nr:ATP synthase F1 subunit gamma [Bacteroidota bacterium]